MIRRLNRHDQPDNSLSPNMKRALAALRAERSERSGGWSADGEWYPEGDAFGIHAAEVERRALSLARPW